MMHGLDDLDHVCGRLPAFFFNLADSIVLFDTRFGVIGFRWSFLETLIFLAGSGAAMYHDAALPKVKCKL